MADMGQVLPVENELWDVNCLSQSYRGVLDSQTVFLAACRAAGASVALVRHRVRFQKAVAARQLVCALLRSTGMSWWKIAALVGYKEHTVVMYSVRRVRARRQVMLGVALQRFRENRQHAWVAAMALKAKLGA